MEVSSKRLDIAVILAVVGPLIGLTLATLFNLIGVIVLVVAWLSVIVVVLLVAYLSLRAHLKKIESEDARRNADNAKIKALIESEVRAGERRAKEIEEFRQQLRTQLRQMGRLRKFPIPLNPTHRKELELWKRRTLVALEDAFGADSQQYEEFEDFGSLSPSSLPGAIQHLLGDDYTTSADLYQRAMDRAEVILKAAIEFEL